MVHIYCSRGTQCTALTDIKDYTLYLKLLCIFRSIGGQSRHSSPGSPGIKQVTDNVCHAAFQGHLSVHGAVIRTHQIIGICAWQNLPLRHPRRFSSISTPQRNSAKCYFSAIRHRCFTIMLFIQALAFSLLLALHGTIAGPPCPAERPIALCSPLIRPYSDNAYFWTEYCEFTAPPNVLIADSFEPYSNATDYWYAHQAYEYCTLGSLSRLYSALYLEPTFYATCCASMSCMYLLAFYCQ